ncbi:protein kinase [Diplodia corticola]|uniref:Protein kinase n=1 Tax=Diplodia corticola TaxID=236234 RepID=A0A1J9R055_9PEZI|nr:protein kinase [Diplodia corticola]OJD33634.1 protein kinase [Diplodia corticola]
MDFLKSAVASAISKGPAFGYSFGDRVDIDQSIWALHNGTKRDDGSKCSIFSFDIASNRSRLPLAKNALRKLRTMRHPGVIKVLDTVETETYIYIATERLVPLSWHTRRGALAQETIKWGLHNVAKTLKFLNGEASSVHGCVRVSSIFTGESGEWKLGGFDVLSSMKEDDAVIYSFGGLVPDANRYAPPEISKGGWDVIKGNPITAIDAYGFGTVVFETFNGSFQGTDQLGQIKSIPPTMQQSYRRLINPSPKARSSVGQFLDQGQRAGGFFQTPLISLTEGIENLGLKGEVERDELLSQLEDVSDDFPEEFFKMKVLPELLKSVEFGGGGPKVFGLVMKIASKLADEEYDAQITPVIVRLFQSPDRAIRVCLLDNLPLMIDHLSNKIVNDKIFPQMVTGFSDTAPVLREQTVKAVLTVTPKLSDRIVNGELLRHLAKTANDEQPGIRTNTTICLGKIARNLGASSRTKVLTAAFGRALRDPFVHARNAALLALAATVDLYTEEDCATKLLPGICPSLVDKEKLIRDQANKTMDIYVARVRKHQTTMPDTVLPPTSSAAASTGGAAIPRMSTPQQDNSWAGWAISSFTNKLTAATGDIQATANGGGGLKPDAPRSSSTPPTTTPTTTTRPTSSTGTASTLHRQTLNKSHPANAPPSSSTEAEPEDFGAAWGDDFNDPHDQEIEADDDAADGWGATAFDDNDDDAHDPFSAPAPTTTKKDPTVPFDDNGEPDFAGWLTAQTKAKQAGKKPLPKGLAGSSSSNRPSAAPRASSAPGGGGAKKSVVTGQVRKTTGMAAAAATAKAEEEKKKRKKEEEEAARKKKAAEEEEMEDEGWGDAWE